MLNENSEKQKPARSSAEDVRNERTSHYLGTRHLTIKVDRITHSNDFGFLFLLPFQLVDITGTSKELVKYRMVATGIKRMKGKL